jgi:hypothetical protein
LGFENVRYRPSASRGLKDAEDPNPDEAGVFVRQAANFASPKKSVVSRLWPATETYRS